MIKLILLTRKAKMALEKSYEIVIFDSDKKKDIKYLPIHIKSIDNDLHEKIIKFIESQNKDKKTYVFDGYGGYIYSNINK